MTFLRPSTVAGAVRRSAAASPQKIALRLDQVERSYEQLLANATRRAGQLAGLGLKRGDRFGVLLPNCIEAVELLLAASMTGFVAVPINTRFKAVELLHIVSHSGMKVLVMVDAIPEVVDFTDVLATALPSLATRRDPRNLSPDEAPALRSVVLLSGEGAPDIFLRFDDLAEAAVDTDDADNSARPILILYTSGTTAKPKGCVILERALLRNVAGIVDRLALTPQDVWWCPLPMFHVGGILFPLLLLITGGTYLTTAYFEADTAIDMIVETAPTILYPLFPTITLQLMESPRFAEMALDRVRYIVNVAPPDLQQRIQQAFAPAVLLGAFGMTETSGVVAYSDPKDSEAQRLGTCGTALKGWEIAIVDVETRLPLSAFQKGEISVRGEGLLGAYLDDPETTARQYTPNGFFLTGDSGMLDSHGMLHFFGRLKDQLKVGGENVSALEVESFLATHPQVKLAQVVGVTDERYGEVVAAFIETHDGHAIDADAIIDFCTGSIARFKIPRYIRYVREWPMSATKIQKFRLKEALEEELVSSSPV